MNAQGKNRHIPRWLSVSTVLVAFTVGVVVLMLWLVGAFRPKISEHDPSAASGRAIGSGRIVEVVARVLPLEETAVGAIQPVHRVEIASRLLARALEVKAIAGQSVAKGDVLVRLEATDLNARRAQAESAVAQAQAALDQARSEASRVRGAFEQNAVSANEMDRVGNNVKGAEANLARSKQSLTEAETVMEFATIRSPIDGTVVDKRVNAGDTVSPGQVVVTVLDPKRMQMVASVRESLSRHLTVGGLVTVRVDVLDHACAGTVSEIVPESQTASRTFQVKVTGPCPQGVYAGMFGRLSIPVGEETVLLIPKESVRTVGQVECVDIAADGVRRRRAVRLGRTMEGQIEVLSGLVAGEKVVVDLSAAPGGK
ncbi:MAG: efflux RND transporter periplasmic adaptor subunit [Planctomycetota bacterium]